MKLKNIHHEIQIRATPDQVWQSLLRYGDVANFHAGVKSSYKEEGSDNEASLGCERVCHIVDLGLKIVLKERIVEFVEGKSYRYEVYEWKNFPVQKLYFEFEILGASQGGTTLALDIDYKAKPAILTPLMAGKMKRLTQDVLLGYKYFTETGESRVPIKDLKNRFKLQKHEIINYG